MKQAPGYTESMVQEMMDKVINGNPAVDPNDIKGLMQILKGLSGDLSKNIVDCGGVGAGSGTCTSAFCLTLGQENEGAYILVPKDGKAGIDASEPAFSHESKDSGATWADYIYRYWTQKFGLAIENPYNMVVYKGIDIPTLRDKTSLLSLVEQFRKAPYRMQLKNKPRIWLMNSSLAEFLDNDVIRQLKGGAGLTSQTTVTNQVQLTFNGDPVILCDAIPNTQGAAA